MKRPLPVEIVGGGLCGLALGLALARRRVPVTVLEASGYPRHRVCGEFISGLDERTAESLGANEYLSDAHLHRSVTYHLRSRPLRPFTLPSAALGISRHTLDARVANAFVEAGGDLRTNTRAPEDGLRPGRVLAVGRKRRGPFWVGLKVHVRNLTLVNDFEVHLGERCYVGLSRVEDGAINVCGIFAPQEHAKRGVDLMLSYLESAGLGELARRIRSAEADTLSFCATAATLGDWRIPSSGKIRLGDACATIPPFTGNGLAMALQGAAMAVAPLVAYSCGEAGWDETALRIASAQRARFRRRLALAALIHPFFLERRRQACLAAVVGSRVIPFSALYAALRSDS
jgi:2-polyprenyl-6-methoxyphenol hydroxylase-like FAD-dependent oxidoreductase